MNSTTQSKQEVLNITPGEWKVDETTEYEISIISPWGDKNKVENSATFGDYRGSLINTSHWNTGVPTREQARANAKAICTAVNETYGKGYNPAAFDELYKALKEMYEYEEKEFSELDEELCREIKRPPYWDRIQTALKNAKL